jgi:hypothetical protein
MKQPAVSTGAAASASPVLRSHLTANVFYPPFIHAGGTSANPIQPVAGWYRSWGLCFDIHWLQSFGGFYASAGLQESNPSFQTTGSVSGVAMMFLNASAGAGWGFPLGKSFQLYAGGLIGYSYFLREWGTGFSFGAEAGLDWIVLRHLALSARISAVDSLMHGLNFLTMGASLGWDWGSRTKSGHSQPMSVATISRGPPCSRCSQR